MSPKKFSGRTKKSLFCEFLSKSVKKGSQNRIDLVIVRFIPYRQKYHDLWWVIAFLFPS